MGHKSVIMAKCVLYQGGKGMGNQKQKSNIICGIPTVIIVLRADTVLSIYTRRTNESGLIQIYSRKTLKNLN